MVEKPRQSEMFLPKNAISLIENMKYIWTFCGNINALFISDQTDSPIVARFPRPRQKKTHTHGLVYVDICRRTWKITVHIESKNNTTAVGRKVKERWGINGKTKRSLHFRPEWYRC